jgi:hypothetical protein
MSQRTGVRVGASEPEKSIGVKIAAAPQTFAAGQIGLTVFYAAD